jgi:hypothetical protein
MRKPNGKQQGERGVTIVEMAVTVVVFSIISGALASVLDLGLDVHRTTPAQVRQLAHRTADRISEQLLFAGIETIRFETAEGPSNTALSFKRCIDTVAGEPVWGPLLLLKWVPEPGDPMDGKDNDGDGSVDEGQVQIHRNWGEPDETMRVLVRGVSRMAAGETWNGADDNLDGRIDERGFRVELRDGCAHVFLTLERPDGTGKTVTESAFSRVAVRN